MSTLTGIPGRLAGECRQINSVVLKCITTSNRVDIGDNCSLLKQNKSSGTNWNQLINISFTFIPSM